jgi:hypothetical protein
LQYTGYLYSSELDMMSASQQQNSPLHGNIEIERFSDDTEQTMRTPHRVTMDRTSTTTTTTTTSTTGLSGAQNELSAQLAYLGSYFPHTNQNQNAPRTPGGCSPWTHLLRLAFVVYTLSQFYLFVTQVWTHPKSFWWLQFLILGMKCVLLGESINKVGIRIDDNLLVVGSTMLGELSTSISDSLRFLIISNTLCLSIEICFSIISILLASSDTEAIMRYLYMVIFFFGILAYNHYICTLLWFGISDSRVAQKALSDMVVLAQRGELRPAIYRDHHKLIKASIVRSSLVESKLVASMIIGMLSAVVLVFNFSSNSFSDNEEEAFNIALVAYIVTILIFSDLLFFVFLFPKCAEVNVGMADLHSTLAEMKWSTEIQEQDRYDTLHLVIAQPVRYTVAGIYITGDILFKQSLGMLSAVAITVLDSDLTYVAIGGHWLALTSSCY